MTATKHCVLYAISKPVYPVSPSNNLVTCDERSFEGYSALLLA